MKFLLAIWLFVSSSMALAFSAEAHSASALAEFLSQRFQLSNAMYRVAMVDLNGDRREEALVYVTAREFCGSGGCKFYILTPESSSFSIVARSTVTRLPIRLLSSSTHGWRDIGVMVSGGGIDTPYQARLRFDGQHYPSNPTMLPAKRMRQVTGTILIS